MVTGNGSSVTGQAVTFTATVTASAPGGGHPTGNVEFYETPNSGVQTPITGCTSQALTGASTDTATCTTGAFVASAGPYTIAAGYAGSSDYLSSNSSAVTQTVSKASTSTATSTNLSAYVSGQTITVSATVSPVAPGTGVPTGAVAVSDGHSGSCTITLTAGTGSCTLSETPGDYTMTGTYSGDNDFSTSNGSAPAVTVSKASTSTATSTDLSAYVSGQTVTVSATVRAVAPGTGVPTGTVSVSDGHGHSCTITLTAGTGSCTVSETPGGYTMTGTYSGDNDFLTSNGSAPAVTVTKAATTTTVSSGTDPSVSGQTTTWTATVAIDSPGSASAASPGGTVTFEQSTDGTQWSTVCNAQANSWNSTNQNAQITCVQNYDATSSGVQVEAIYSGDANFSTSTSAGVVQTVNRAATSTSLASSIDPTVSGQGTTWTATVTIDAPGTNDLTNPTAGIEFEQSSDQGQNWTPISGPTSCADQLMTWSGVTDQGTATCDQVYDADQNQVEVRAIYLGDANFAGSTSTGGTQTVNPAATITQLTSGTNPTISGQPMIWTATVGITSPGTAAVAPPGGTVTLEQKLPGASGYTPVPACTDVPVHWVSSSQVDTASCDQAYTSAQSGIQVEAFYNGDSNYVTSSSGPVTQNVNPSTTTTTLTSGTNPTISGQATVWTARVTVDAPGSAQPLAPGGTVEFEQSTDGGTTWAPVTGCAAQTPTWSTTAGTATCSQSYTANQNGIELEALYQGDPTNGFAASQSTAVAQTVGTASTTTGISASVNPSVSGRTVTWTATVIITGPGSDAAGDPTGYVAFDQSTDGGQTWQAISGSTDCSAVPLTWQNSAGTAACPQAYDTASNGVEVRARYVSGDANFSDSTSGGVTEATNRASTTIGVTPSANPAVSGQTVSWSADIAVAQPGSDSPTAPSGTVTFQQSTDSGATWADIAGCTAETMAWVPGSGGTASCDQTYGTSSSGVAVEAFYSGDSNFTPSSSPSVTETVDQATTAISVASGTNPSVTGQPTTWTATLTVSGPGSDAVATPSGTITFLQSSDGIQWSTACAAQAVTWDATGHQATATCFQNYAETADGIQVEAAYSGDNDFLQATSDPVAQGVDAAGTTTVTQSSVSPSVSGDGVTWTASVGVAGPGSDSVVVPSGTVEFDQSTDGGNSWSPIDGCETQPLAWSTTDHAGRATCVVAYAASSDGLEVRATYTSADTNFTGSQSDAAAQNVDQAATATAVSSDTNPAVSGQATNWTATVTISSPGSDEPTAPGGTVSFQQSTDNGGTWSPVTGCRELTLTWDSTHHQGTAECDNQAYSASQTGLEVEATYSGDGNFSTSTSPAVSQTVSKATTVTSVAPDPTSTVSGQPTTWTASVVVSSPGAGVPAAPTGTVEFERSTNGGQTWSPITGCTAFSLTGGSASCTQSYLATANGVQVKAIYSGDTNFLTSTSTSADEGVARAATTGSLSVSRNATVTGQQLVISDRITVTPPGTDGAGAPSGTILFQQSSDGGSHWSNVPGCGAIPLTWDTANHQGQASCVTAYDSAAGPGYLVRGVYAGDLNFIGVITSSTGISVSADATSTAVSSDRSPSSPGENLTFTASVTAALPGAATPTGTVEFADGATVLCARAPVAAGVATCDVRLADHPFSQTITATYSGSSSLNGSSGSMVQSVEHGYWLVGSDGSVRAFGEAVGYGSAAGVHLDKPMVGMAATPDGKGYWTVAADGGVFAYGDAHFYGSTGGTVLAKPIIAIVPSADGKGYYMVASDGGVFAFGDAGFYGSAASYRLAGPIVGMVLSPDGRGYYLVGSDGGVFAYGDARFHGSGSGSVPAGTPVVGLAPSADLAGYWLAMSNGKVLNFGDAPDFGSVAHPSAPAVGISSTSDGTGFWVVAANGAVYSLGDATNDGSASHLPAGTRIVGMADL
ncbi:MAG TPA: Ig-like domain-containing protein [Acidimicrobiales bacterium]|nr:Ig-like domain-containing protein [Acidimicrobiales bacterium]